MKWLGKWLLKLAQKANEDERNDRVYATSAPKLARASDIEAAVESYLGGAK